MGFPESSKRGFREDQESESCEASPVVSATSSFSVIGDDRLGRRNYVIAQPNI